MVETDEAEDDMDKDDNHDEDNCMPYINRQTVDGDSVGSIAHLDGNT